MPKKALAPTQPAAPAQQAKPAKLPSKPMPPAQAGEFVFFFLGGFNFFCSVVLFCRFLMVWIWFSWVFIFSHLGNLRFLFIFFGGL